MSWQSPLRYLVILLCSGIIFILMNELLKSKRSADATRPSSFFSLDQITSRFRFRSISLFYAGSAAILYGAVALQGGDLLRAIKKMLLSYMGKDTANIGPVFEAIPDWLDPIFVLFVFLLLFAARIRAPLLLYRDMIVGGAGLYSMVDETSMAAAHKLMDRNESYESASTTLLSVFQEAPLPEELVSERNAQRIAFQMIWLSLPVIKDVGVAPAFESLKGKLGLPIDDKPISCIGFMHLVAAATIFLVLMGVYIIVIPKFGQLLPHNVEWPNPDLGGWSPLIISVLKNTLAFAFPLLLAVNMYPLRRRAYAKRETAVTSMVIVASAQWLLAFLVLELFNVTDVVMAYDKAQTGYTLSLPRLHIGAFLYALCPIIAFAAWVKLRPMLAAGSAFIAIICFIVGVSFGLCDAVYECYYRFDFYFFHQALLGVFITLAFFLATSLAMNHQTDEDSDFARTAGASI